MKLHEQRKDDFIRMASHELRTPVTSIKGYVQLLLTMFDDHENNIAPIPDEAIRSSLIVIDKQIVRLTRLLSELLDLSRIDSGKLDFNMHPFELNDLVRETVNDLKLTTVQELKIRSNGSSKVNADRNRIGQVLTNLLTNAIKYSPEASAVEIDVVKHDEKKVTVSVTDHGIGIDPKDQKKIFERFYRVEGKSEQTYPGFGIGLFIASEIIQRHHGIISVESSKGNGAKFSFTLPLDKTD
jgi:signal transduction histidine kinase